MTTICKIDELAVALSNLSKDVLRGSLPSTLDHEEGNTKLKTLRTHDHFKGLLTSFLNIDTGHHPPSHHPNNLKQDQPPSSSPRFMAASPSNRAVAKKATKKKKEFDRAESYEHALDQLKARLGRKYNLEDGVKLLGYLQKSQPMKKRSGGDKKKEKRKRK